MESAATRLVSPNEFGSRDDGVGDVEGADCTSQNSLRVKVFETFFAQHEERARRFLTESMSGLSDEERANVVGNERVIIAEAIEATLRAFTDGGGQGLSFEQVLRAKLNEVLRTSYDVWVAAYQAYRSPNGAFRKGPGHEDQLARNAELVEIVSLAKASAELRELVLAQAGILLNARFPAEAFCTQGRKDLEVTARQISDLVDNFYLWFLEQFNGEELRKKGMSEKEILVGYLYVFGGLDAAGVCAKVKTFEERDFAPKDGKTPPEGQYLMGSYGLDDAASVEASYQRVREEFAANGATYLARFLDEVSLRDTESVDLIRNWRQIRRHRDQVFTPVNGRGMPFTAMDIDRVERMQIAISETEWAICLEELNLMRLQRGDLSARNRVLMRIYRLIGRMCRNGYAAYWLDRRGLSDAVLDLQQELSVVMMEKMAMCDPTKSRLSTYMVRWIRTALARVIEREDLVRLPSWVHDLLYYCRNHREVSDEEVVAYLSEHGRKIAVKTVARLRRSNFTMLYLDTPVTEHDPRGDGKSKGTIGDLLEVSMVGAKEFPAAMQARRDIIVHRMLAALPPRHAKVLMMRYVLGMEFQAIADELSVTRQAIEFIELYALRSLRALSDVEDLDKDRVEQKGTRAKITEKGDDNHPRSYVFLIYDQKKWEQWCAAQTDISDEQMLWFRLYLGLEGSNGFGRLNATSICKNRMRAGKKGPPPGEFHRVTRLLHERLRRDLAVLPDKEQFVRSFPRFEMFSKAAAWLNCLQISL